MPKHNVLIVEDEEMMRSILRTLLTRDGYEVFTADSAEAALEVISSADISLTLTDIRMSGADGIELLDRIKSLDDEALVIVITAYSSVDTAIAALRKGAYDYVTKPFVNEDLLQTVRNAISHRDLYRENRLLHREIKKRYTLSEIIGKSDAIQEVFALVRKVAATSASVLIAGESGTGKELIARSIHFNSSRAEKPFLAVNCGALPESLLESELFGHTKGSFTGAVTDTPGLFRSVDGGTLLLDEVSEMPASLQVKLLRSLQEHEVTPVGSSSPIRFDARIIAATNRDLETEVAEGRFRDDLFYRLNVVEITVPSLRDRKEDIPLLIKHFVSKTTAAENLPAVSISEEAMDLLLNYHWPGNIRELQNVIERAVILCDDQITATDLPPNLRPKDALSELASDRVAYATLDEMERRYISETLNAVNDDKSAAAEILGIDLSTLYRKLKRYEGS